MSATTLMPPVALLSSHYVLLAEVPEHSLRIHGPTAQECLPWIQHGDCVVHRRSLFQPTVRAEQKQLVARSGALSEMP